MKRLLIIGAGGHCRAVLDVVRAAGRYETVGLVGVEQELGSRVGAVEVIGTDRQAETLLPKVDACILGVGQIGNGRMRSSLWNRWLEAGAEFATVISPHAYVAPDAVIERGSIVMHGAIVNTGARVAANCIVNSMALIEHDAVVGEHSHVSTRATVNGGTQVGPYSFVGSGAVLYHGIRLPAETVVPAGATISGNG